VGVKNNVTINDVVNKNFKTCEIKKLDVYIETSGALKAIAPSSIQSMIPYDIVENASLIYINFEGIAEGTILKVTRGLYSKIKVTRNDGKRFNDQLTFTLSNTLGGQFELVSADTFIQQDSYLGLLQTPFFMGTKNSALYTIFLLGVSTSEAYVTGQYAPLPSLPIEVTEASLNLPVASQIRCYRSYETLPLIIELTQIPVDPLVVTLSIQTLNSSSNLAIKSTIANPITLSKTNLFQEIIIVSSHAQTADPISDDKAKLVLTPAAGTSFQTTYVD
jgi:hypothetical protein